MNTIYFAAGCFWGTEKLYRSIDGVENVTCGYANGKHLDSVSYEMVCTGLTDLKETVKVEYDPSVVSLKALIFAFYCCIDKEMRNRQGMDFGSQYQSGIFWSDAESELEVRKYSEVEAGPVPGSFAVLLEPIDNFYPAEDYHQRYLEKNPHGYCHISPARIAKIAGLDFNSIDYNRPAKDILAFEFW